MWICKECGETEINAVYSGEWMVYKRVIDKSGKTEKVCNSDKNDLGGYIYEYECANCGNHSEELEEIAKWEE